MPKILSPEFRYSNAAASAKEGYLRQKWMRLYPGWNRRPTPAPAPEAEVVQLKRKAAR